MDFERFNRIMDTDTALRAGLSALVARYGELGEESYTTEMLSLLRNAELELTAEELRRLLGQRLRRQCEKLAGTD